MSATQPVEPQSLAELAFAEVRSDDGTRLRAWTNDPGGTIDGPTVLLCNGLGTSAWTWPAFLDPTAASGSSPGTTAAPAAPSGRPTAAGSASRSSPKTPCRSSTTTASSARSRWAGRWASTRPSSSPYATPNEFSGLFAVAGVPGDTFSTMLAPLRLPPLAAKTVAVNLARTLKYAGRAITPVAARLPVGERTVAALTHSGLMFDVPDRDLAARAVAAFLETPVEWYMHVALHTARHPRVSLRGIRVPAAFVAGRFDVLAGPTAMASAAARIDGATYTELRGSHFLQMEQPDRVHSLLLEFLRRVG